MRNIGRTRYRHANNFYTIRISCINFYFGRSTKTTILNSNDTGKRTVRRARISCIARYRHIDCRVADVIGRVFCITCVTDTLVARAAKSERVGIDIDRFVDAPTIGRSLKIDDHAIASRNIYNIKEGRRRVGSIRFGYRACCAKRINRRADYIANTRGELRLQRRATDARRVVRNEFERKMRRRATHV